MVRIRYNTTGDWISGVRYQGEGEAWSLFAFMLAVHLVNALRMIAYSRDVVLSLRTMLEVKTWGERHLRLTVAVSEEGGGARGYS
jgi:hypothetical protein